MEHKHLYKEGKPGNVRFVRSEEEERIARADGYMELTGVYEYPRSLYLAGDRNQQELVVTNAAEEKAARRKGFLNLDEVEGKKADAKE